MSAAIINRHELVYGDIKQFLYTGEERIIGKFPPEVGHISMQGALYMKMLDFFEWDTSSWVLNEPGDWNIVRRMMDANVKIGKINKIVGNIYSANPEAKN